MTWNYNQFGRYTYGGCGQIKIGVPTSVIAIDVGTPISG
ncbi:hypothetical protein N692_14560 [Lactiplantibacillus plantarum EGD-AQ4]|nr:hypothetical protein N692_14560 [Lactiplantibacillus plantarum EGD-AQ4]